MLKLIFVFTLLLSSQNLCEATTGVSILDNPSLSKGPNI